MEEYNEIKISSVKQFLDIIEELSKTYPSHGIINIPYATKFIFRGVCDESYPLLPCILRKDIQKFEHREISNNKYQANEKEILRSFAAEAAGNIHDIPQSDLHRWAEFAQHFGVPTRFLDWTSNPLTAMFFACNTSNEKNSAVWILNNFNYLKFAAKKENDTNSKLIKKKISEISNLMLSGEQGLNYPIVYRPFYVDQRMSAQSSYFMIWGNNNNPFETMIFKDNWMIISNKDKNGVRGYGSQQEEGILLKLTIYSDRKQEIMRQLDMLGTNEKTLFPGLDGIGQYIERKYRFDYNESVENFL